MVAGMLRNAKTVRIVVLAVASLLLALGSNTVGRQQQQIPLPTGRAPASPSDPFRPSNTRTEDGALIPVEQFYPAARCQKCHLDPFNSFEHSLHRNAGREPFYRDSADILVKALGLEFTPHFQAFHTPAALLAGELH